MLSEIRFVRFVSLAALLAACGDVTTDGDTSANAGVPTARETQADTVLCLGRGEGSGFGTEPLPTQTGPFTLEFSARPEGRTEDALFGLASGPPSHYTDLAAILRFNPAGKVDARNGGAYAASEAVSYTPFSLRQYRLTVDPAAHRYSALQVAPAGVAHVADDFAFRSEQQSTSSLDHVGLVVDDGYLGVCGWTLEEPCHHSSAGDGFWNHTVASQSIGFTAAVSATPDADNMDGVIGFSGEEAGTYSDIALAVRFNPDGFIDARNGGGYAADQAIPYSAGTTYRFRFLVDLFTHTYTAFVGDQVLAKNYAFRSQQATVSQIRHGAVVADEGSLQVCDFATAEPERLLYLHPIEHYPSTNPTNLVPLDDGGLLMVDSDHTLELDFKGDIARTLPWGGGMASVDAAGNRYIVSAFEGSYDGGGGPVPSHGGLDIRVSRYDAQWNHVYTRAIGTADDDQAGGFGVNASGELAVRSWDTLYRLDAAGNVQWTRPISPLMHGVVLDDQGNSYTVEPVLDTTTFYIHKYDAANQEVWVRSGTSPEGHTNLTAIRPTPDGKLILNGYMEGEFEISGGVLEADPGGPFVVELDTDGTYLWGRALPGTGVPTGFGLDSAGRMTICGGTFDPARLSVTQLDEEGTILEVMSNDDLLNGLPDDYFATCVVDGSGNVYVLPNSLFYSGNPRYPSFLMKLNGLLTLR